MGWKEAAINKRIPQSFSRMNVAKIHRPTQRPFSSFAGVSSRAIRAAASPQEAVRLYTNRRKLSLPVDSYVALCTLKACSHLSSPSLIRQLHAHLFKFGLNTHVYAATALLTGYVNCSFNDALVLFDEMPRNVVTWNVMITGYEKMGDVKQARSLFDEMPTRNLESWSAMIAAYMSSGRWNQGVIVFRKMIDEGLRPDKVTLVTLLSGCSHMVSPGLLGKSVHSYAVKNQLDLNVALDTALVDMYAKCGFLDSASRIFERMSEKNVMSWSAMVCGLASHGRGEEVIRLFAKMIDEKVRPNEFTFTGVLNACSHAGMVDEGRKNFHRMIEEFGLVPRVQHYGCMVHLLGKAGLLDEAYELIKTMRIESNIVLWSSLLAACKMHRNFEMAERVVERVLNMAKPDKDGGVYTLISDLYAANGKWDRVEELRKLMAETNVNKVRGSSFIEVEEPGYSTRSPVGRS